VWWDASGAWESTQEDEPALQEEIVAIELRGSAGR
jgi:hypothetical protein